ncbi:DUF1616 domain-containing protein [Halorientalis pallida]|uniref:DUF1616 domain-containing protein n=1 Tax=Halorientalis pallida TaxID=2479928 RepID=UPI003C6ED70A
MTDLDGSPNPDAEQSVVGTYRSTDLVFTVLLGLASVIVSVAPGIQDTLLRPIITLPFLTVSPGYAVISALYPMGQETEETSFEFDYYSGGNIRTPARIGLSVSMSLALLAVFGVLLSFSPFQIDLTTVLVLTVGCTTLCSAIAIRRRRSLPVRSRYSFPLGSTIRSALQGVSSPGSWQKGVVNVAVIVSILLLIGAVGYTLAVPPQDERFSEFYLLTGAEGEELSADGYPTMIGENGTDSIVVAIGNQEYETTDYTVVVQLQRVRDGGPNSTDTDGEDTRPSALSVIETETLDRYTTRLAHGESTNRRVTLAPTMTGEDLRLAFLLYRGAPPDGPTIANAYRVTHLWVDVPDESTGSDTTKAE